MPGLHRNNLHDLIERIRIAEHHSGPFLGINSDEKCQCWAEQIISSLRRISYTESLIHRNISPSRSNPLSTVFDPIKGAIYLNRQGAIDEAVWLTFILTHFGKHAEDGWKLARNIYGSFDEGPVWTFENYTANTKDFANMLDKNSVNLSNLAISGRFSNHRKYESKKPAAIEKTFRTFHDWQCEFGRFRERIVHTHKRVGQEPQAGFHELYNSMQNVARFGGGRLGRFDFLTMLGKLQIAPISPGSVYLQGASGPLYGARLLFFNNRDNAATGKELEARVDALDNFLNVGKQVIEDSLCNWQKSPERYVYFRG